MYKLKLNELVSAIPTIGFNVENLKLYNSNLTIWDVGGQEKIRSLWRHYYQGTNLLFFLVDSTDSGRIEEAKEALDKILAEPELEGVPLVLLANKQDMHSAMKPEAVFERLGLGNVENRKVCVKGYSAMTSLNSELFSFIEHVILEM